MLRNAGHTVHCAGTTAAGVRVLSAHRVDVVLLDIMMPHGEDHEEWRRFPLDRGGCLLPHLLRRGQIPNADPQTPIVVYTALVLSAAERTMLDDLEVSAVHPKPTPFLKLIESLETAVKARATTSC
jgi:CheY-like chemotaxis protein